MDRAIGIDQTDRTGQAAERHAAAARGERGVDVDARRCEVDLAARSQGQRISDSDALGRPYREAAETEAADRVGVEPAGAGAVGGRRGVAEGDLRGRRQNRRNAAEHAIALQRQSSRQRHRILRELVTVGDACDPRAALALAVDDIGNDVALEHARRRRQSKLASVAADAVGLFPAQRGATAVEHRGPGFSETLVNLPLDIMHARKAAGKSDEVETRRRVIDTVPATVAADQIGRADPARGIIQRASGNIERRPLPREHFGGRQRDAAADCRPLADRVRGGAEIAADLEQSARRIVAIRRIATGAGRDQRQAAHIDPDVVVLEHAGVAVLRRVPQFVALHVDGDVVRRHRQRHIAHARHIERGAGFRDDTLVRGHHDLAALRRRRRTALEGDGAAGHDLDAGLILAVGQLGEVVELGSIRLQTESVLRGRIRDQRVALAIERGLLAVEFGQHGGEAASPQRDAAGAVRCRVKQMDGAAGIHRGGRHQRAALGDAAAGQRDVALLGEHQAGIAHSAVHAAIVKHRRDFAAARRREAVGGGADARPQDEVVAGRQDGLAFRRPDRTGIAHLGADHQHVAAARRHRCRRARIDGCPRLDDHLAAGCGERRHISRPVLRRIDTVAAELCVGDSGGRCDQRADIDLAAAAENDAALVDHIDLTVGLDVTEDLTRRRRVVDAVQRHPVGIALLIECQCGAGAHVEGLPVQDRLLRGLPDADLGLAGIIDALGRRIGAIPAGGHIGQQAAGTEAVRHGDRGRQRSLPRHGRRTRSRLDALHILHGARCSCQRTLRLPCCRGSLLSCPRRRVRCDIGRCQRAAAAATVQRFRVSGLRRCRCQCRNADAGQKHHAASRALERSRRSCGNAMIH